MNNPSRQKQQDLLALTASALATTTVAGIGSAASIRAREDYAKLRQPSWAPPGWVFGPVWTMLYAMMTVAAWLVWREEPREAGRPALRAYAAQLGLNAIWSPLFFGLGKRGAALVDSVLLWGAIVATIRLFARRSPLAAALLVPYFAWATFATALNWSAWQRNK